ncbi:hypothetical protein RF11_07403 [Thelohanellus kitauei]|uniref:Uncharacterized protein n=1 Tax=Thelohanellus kitauei TaxID=669202 RepID=A0A0C2JJ10_THEKT|nr:hypothetical protein RF11_07403 [Thelohanellus kitauei]
MNVDGLFNYRKIMAIYYKTEFGEFFVQRLQHVSDTRKIFIMDNVSSTIQKSTLGIIISFAKNLSSSSLFLTTEFYRAVLLEMEEHYQIQNVIFDGNTLLATI